MVSKPDVRIHTGGPIGKINEPPGPDRLAIYDKLQAKIWRA